MVGMKDMLTSEKMYLEEVIKKAKLQLKKAGIQGDILENKLRISVDKERIRYYKCTPDNKKGSYILKKDLEVAKKLAQNEYNYKLLKKNYGCGYNQIFLTKHDSIVVSAHRGEEVVKDIKKYFEEIGYKCKIK